MLPLDVRGRGWRAAAAPLVTLLLAACGGIGGDSGSPPEVRVNGWVGERSAWPQAPLAFSCADGSRVQALSAADGRYAATLPAAALPCLVQARGTDGGLLWSAAVGAGTVNISTLSNAIVARTLHLAPAAVFGSAALAQRLTPGGVSEARTALATALADIDLGTRADPITTPIDANAASDALVRANGRLVEQLEARGVTMLSFNHALATRGDALALRGALAAGDLRRLLDLPAASGLAGMAPQLVRGAARRLAGSAGQALLLGDDFAFRSDDEGRRWLFLNVVLDRVVAYKGALLGAGPDRLLRSTDGGITWTAASPDRLGNGELEIAPDGRLWWFNSRAAWASDDGVRWVPAVADTALREALFNAVHRLPPLRSVVPHPSIPGSVRACLGTDCLDVDVGGWSVASLMRVHGSDEVLAMTDVADPHLAISADGLQWRAMTAPGTTPAAGFGVMPRNGVLRTASGRLLGMLGDGSVHASDDDGQTWQRAAPATTDEWQAIGDATAWRRAANGAAELSVDGGQHWQQVPEPFADVTRQARSPDGTLLRIVPARPLTGLVERSTDGGRSWSVALAEQARAVAWLGDRFGAILEGNSLRTSPDGQQWTPVGPVPSWSTESSFAGADGVWVVGFREYPTLYQHSLFESRDEGRTWSRIFHWSEPGGSDASRAIRCGGVLFAGDVRPAIRRASGWQPLAVPAEGASLGCVGDLLMAGDANASTHGQYASADHGATWTAIGRPRSSIVLDDGRWWSVSPTSATLWPR